MTKKPKPTKNKAFTQVPISILNDFKRSCMLNNISEHQGFLFALTIFTQETMKGEESEYKLKQPAPEPKPAKITKQRKVKIVEEKPVMIKDEDLGPAPEMVLAEDTPDIREKRKKGFFEKWDDAIKKM